MQVQSLQLQTTTGTYHIQQEEPHAQLGKLKQHSNILRAVNGYRYLYFN